jgi:hypothetical protein
MGIFSLKCVGVGRLRAVLEIYWSEFWDTPWCKSIVLFILLFY